MNDSFEDKDGIVWRTSQYPADFKTPYPVDLKHEVVVPLDLEIDDPALYSKLYEELKPSPDSDQTPVEEEQPAQSPIVEAIGQTAAESGLFGCLVLGSGLFYVYEWFKKNLGR